MLVDFGTVLSCLCDYRVRLSRELILESMQGVAQDDF